MKWDKKNKERLIALLSDKLRVIYSENKPDWNFYQMQERRKDNFPWSDAMEEEFNSNPIVRKWRAFTSQYGITEVARSRNSPWRTGGCPWEIHTRPRATNSKRIIIDDPLDKLCFVGRPKRFGLSIPKDVAERFLVLGVP